MQVSTELVWGEFYRLLRGRMKMPRGGATGGGSMQTMFEIPMVTEVAAQSMFAAWPTKADEADPCWELATMQQCASGLAFEQSAWTKDWGHGNARPMFISSTEATAVLLAAPPITARLRKTTEKLNVLQVNLAFVLYTETDTVVLPPDSTDPSTGFSTPFYADPPSQPGLHRDAFKAHAKTMVGELLTREFVLSSALAAQAPAQYQQQLAADKAAAAEAEEVAEIAAEQEAGMYRVHAILQERVVPGKRKRNEYLVQWVGYTQESNTWEPENLVKGLDAFRDWKAAQAQAGSTSSTQQA